MNPNEVVSFPLSGEPPPVVHALYAKQKYQDHQKLLNVKGPAIIIAGSGMCTGGRIVDHLQHGLDDPQNDIFLSDIRLEEHPAER